MSAGVFVQGKTACVVGRSNIVGLPAALLLQNRDATVTMVHSKTPNAQQVCQQADIVIAACGKVEMVTGDWIKEGAAVIDVGINAVDVRASCRNHALTLHMLHKLHNTAMTCHVLVQLLERIPSQCPRSCHVCSQIFCPVSGTQVCNMNCRY